MFFLLSVTAPFTSIKPAYARPVLIAAADIPSSARPLNVAYGNVARLLAYEVGKDAVRHGEMLPVTLYWQAEQRVPKDYRVTVRLLAPTGRLLWQTDAGPVHDGYPMTAWREGETVTDAQSREAHP